jgi:hypothetical protein
MLRTTPRHVDLLILGAGWTSQFLIPQLDKEEISHAETTTTGRNGTIPFKFDPDHADPKPYENLPSATTVLITFPLKGHGQSRLISQLYRQVHGAENNWIQLGASSIYNKAIGWNDEDSPYDKENERAIAEDELREVVHGCVLNLSGLYGGERKPRTWIPRLAKNKEDVRKRKCVHFVHGDDVASAIIATHRNFTPGKRWIIADLRVYDWYDLILSFTSLAEDEDGEGIAEEKEKMLPFANWVGELMIEEGVRALPRSVESFERKLDSRGFWQYHGIWPKHKRLA